LLGGRACTNGTLQGTRRALDRQEQSAAGACIQLTERRRKKLWKTFSPLVDLQAVELWVEWDRREPVKAVFRLHNGAALGKVIIKPEAEVTGLSIVIFGRSEVESGNRAVC